jgi:hypothetical protein
MTDNYLMKLWREAVLKTQRKCAWCGKRITENNHQEFECHHIVRRAGSRLLRWDWRNGVAVCARTDCHKKIASLEGQRKLMGEHGHWDYLEIEEQMSYKDTLMRKGMTVEEFRKNIADELKKIII